MEQEMKTCSEHSVFIAVIIIVFIWIVIMRIVRSYWYFNSIVLTPLPVSKINTVYSVYL